METILIIMIKLLKKIEKKKIKSSEDLADDLEKQLQEEEEKAKQEFVFKSETSAEEIEKSKHAVNQKSIWDSFLDSRIRIQRLLVDANSFPKPNPLPLFLKNNEISKRLENIKESVSSLLENFVDMKLELYKQNPLTEEIQKKKKY